MAALRRVCVFCGSRPGARPDYADAARALAAELVGAGIDLVYGGGRVGLMGVMADAVLEAGGEVIGVLPDRMWGPEVAHTGLTELRMVGSMHERKALMYELADGFVALPGGLGTLEELFEITTWSQLGLHAKPTGLLDVAGFYTPLVGFLDRLVTEGFVSEPHRRLLRVAADPTGLLDLLAAFPG